MGEQFSHCMSIFEKYITHDSKIFWCIHPSLVLCNPHYPKYHQLLQSTHVLNLKRNNEVSTNRTEIVTPPPGQLPSCPLSKLLQTQTSPSTLAGRPCASMNRIYTSQLRGYSPGWTGSFFILTTKRHEPNTVECVPAVSNLQSHNQKDNTLHIANRFYTFS